MLRSSTKLPMFNSQPRLFLVDVFTEEAFWGNPVAVIGAGIPLAPEQMLRIARWTGMPETVFVLPLDARHDAEHAADYQVRIWSPACELAFAGHPSIGAAHVLLEEGLIAPKAGRFNQLCIAGCIDMCVTTVGARRRVSFRTPIPTVEQLDDAGHADVLNAIGCNAALAKTALVEAGARWIIVEMKHASDVNALRPAMDRVLALSALHNVSGVTVLGRAHGGDADYEVRSFAPAIGVPEDAVCGGGNACAAAWVASQNDWREGSADSVINQGKQVGRAGRVFWKGPDRARHIEIGGFAVTVSAGTFHVP
jgi:PhzF family phenazine biosynthesis protein